MVADLNEEAEKRPILQERSLVKCRDSVFWGDRFRGSNFMGNLLPKLFTLYRFQTPLKTCVFGNSAEHQRGSLWIECRKLGCERLLIKVHF